MSRFDYPRLTRSEILSFLVDSQIFSNVTAQHLADPTPDFVSDLYTQLLIHLASFQEEDGQMEFAALELLENLDLHVDSVRIMNLFSRVKEVVVSLHCPTQFSLKDLVKPDAGRTEIFVGAILNFCFHKDNKMNLLKPMVEELNLLDEQQKEWETKLSQAVRKLEELSQIKSERENRCISLEMVECKLKDKSREINEKNLSATFELQQSSRANEELHSEIKLQRSFKEEKKVLEEERIAENLANQSLEGKSAVMEVYTKVFKKLSKHLTMMQKLQEQASSAKAIDKEVKALKSKISNGVLDKSLDAKLVELQGREEQLDEQKKQVQKESHTKCVQATKKVNNVKIELESRKHELEARQRKVESVLAEVDSITSRTNSIKEFCAAEQQELLRRCEDIMKEVFSRTA